MLVFRPVDRPTSADDFGILPRVADLLVTVAPLAVIMARPAAEPLCFLNPKLLALAVGVLALLGRGFLDSSPLLRPASDGERFTWEALGESLPFSDTFASSVFPGREIGKVNLQTEKPAHQLSLFKILPFFKELAHFPLGESSALGGRRQLFRKTI